MKTISVEYTEKRVLGLLPSISLVAIVESYAEQRLMLRYRRVPNSQSNFGHVGRREVRHEH